LGNIKGGIAPAHSPSSEPPPHIIYPSDQCRNRNNQFLNMKLNEGIHAHFNSFDLSKEYDLRAVHFLIQAVLQIFPPLPIDRILG
jgi:hypothetical protein